MIILKALIMILLWAMLANFPCSNNNSSSKKNIKGKYWPMNYKSLPHNSSSNSSIKGKYY